MRNPNTPQHYPLVLKEQTKGHFIFFAKSPLPLKTRTNKTPSGTRTFECVRMEVSKAADEKWMAKLFDERGAMKTDTFAIIKDLNKWIDFQFEPEKNDDIDEATVQMNITSIRKDLGLSDE